jgi:hypothetical protein
MNDSAWIAGNQLLLCAEFARLKARLAADQASPADTAPPVPQIDLEAPAAIETLVDTFGLTAFEREVLLLCAGVEMDGALASEVSSFSEGANTQGVSFGLALSRLADPHWSALTPMRPLRRWRLVELQQDRGLTSGRLSVDERILHFLAGLNYLDPRLRSLVLSREPTAALAPSHAEILDAACEAIELEADSVQAVQLIGDDAAAQAEVAAQISAQLGLRLHSLRAIDIPTGPHEAEALATLWNRESKLLPSALLIDSLDANTPSIACFVRRLIGLVLIAGPEPIVHDCADLRFDVNRPGPAEQRLLWNNALGDAAAHLNGSLDGVASQFRLSTDAIERTARAMLAHAPASLPAELWRACRESARTRLEDLAQRVDPQATWIDLVLPEPQLATLHQISAHVRHRLKVYEDWGFARKGMRGLGISVLFTGESGTGKTMAAEVLANDLRLDLYRIDLASMVSKYIGETEKNLRRVFDAAEDSGAILLFDEADALFGKRSEVSDSRDRYANIEVSYLLQRMEAYRGLAILTTNLKNALDTAFQRRLRFVVQFPFPDARLRERIWSAVFPENTPTSAIDLRRLAQLNVAGGNIRSIALNAAFLAADEQSPVSMRHLQRAARSEAAKRERPFSDAELREWA